MTNALHEVKTSTNEAEEAANKAAAEATRIAEEKALVVVEQHKKDIAQANQVIANMNSAIMVHEAEKAASQQATQEFLQANLKLRASVTLLNKQGEEGFGLRDKKIKELEQEIANRDARIKELENRIEISNKVIAASTNLIPPGMDKPADSKEGKDAKAKHA
jgi:wobble nucleotide-excising tRNase